MPEPSPDGVGQSLQPHTIAGGVVAREEGRALLTVERLPADVPAVVEMTDG